jgi:hypothetical protein
MCWRLQGCWWRALQPLRAGVLTLLVCAAVPWPDLRLQIDGMYAALKAAGQAAPAPKAPAAGGGSSKRTPAVA